MVGHILCASFVDIPNCGVCEPKVETYRLDDKRFRIRKDPSNDSKLAAAIRDRLELTDIVVGHNSKLFDLKFLKARLAKYDLRPPNVKWHLDTMWTARSHLRASSKLDNLQHFLDLPDEKTAITWDDWARGAALQHDAMDRIVEHCEKDVLVLAQAYWRLLPMVRTLKRDG
ncbi:MAG TPA: ribonuclease H-like domain-containing protein [Thermoleophilia bacterium]|nr:ribonuclease H-like domain-containing protein [Thermoleophilia bacterium]